MNKTRYELERRLSSLSAASSTNTDSSHHQLSQADYDVIVAHHRFLWDNAPNGSWKDKLAKSYSDKLFKEYCISDLSGYRSSGIALRWRTERELLSGKGERSCADKSCDHQDHLKTWEVPFAYSERGEKKSALVKVRLCKDCSQKLTYYYAGKKSKKIKSDSAEQTADKLPPAEQTEASTSNQEEEIIWDNLFMNSENKSQGERIQDYLNDLFCV